VVGVVVRAGRVAGVEGGGGRRFGLGLGGFLRQVVREVRR